MTKKAKMPKHFRTKKTEKDGFLTKNHEGAIKYRLRLQEDAESEQEVKQYLKEPDADQSLQDPIRRDNLQK